MSEDDRIPSFNDTGGLTDPEDFHAVDYELWWMNIRANVAERLAAWQRQSGAT